MKVSFGRFGDAFDSARFNQFLADLERAFARVFDGGKLSIGGGQAIDKHFMASATWDPANVNDGAQTTTTVTVTGARLVDASPVMVGFDKDLQGMRLTGYVSADDTVTVVLRNDTGGAINLASGTLRVGVWRY